jgi:hypothetical protein
MRTTLTQLRTSLADHVARSLPGAAAQVGHATTGESVYRLPDGGLCVLLPLRDYNAQVRRLARTEAKPVTVRPTATWHPSWGFTPLAA